MTSAGQTAKPIIVHRSTSACVQISETAIVVSDSVHVDTWIKLENAATFK